MRLGHRTPRIHERHDWDVRTANSLTLWTPRHGCGMNAARRELCRQKGAS
jgi:hypothetical protein